MSVRLREEEAGLFVVTLCRPARHNAFDLAMCAGLEQAVLGLEAAGAKVRCVILEGEGHSFSSGADLTMLQRATAAEGAAFMTRVVRSLQRLAALPAPLLGGAKGYCLGGGFETLLHCDLIVAAEEAQFALPEAALGLSTTAGTVARLAAAIGAMRARDLLLTGRRMAADEALRVGLCAAVVPGDRLAEAVRERARVITASPPAAVGAMKQLLTAHFEGGTDAARSAELATFARLLRGRPPVDS